MGPRLCGGDHPALANSPHSLGHHSPQGFQEQRGQWDAQGVWVLCQQTSAGFQGLCNHPKAAGAGGLWAMTSPRHTSDCPHAAGHWAVCRHVGKVTAMAFCCARMFGLDIRKHFSFERAAQGWGSPSLGGLQSCEDLALSYMSSGHGEVGWGS